MTKAAMTSDKQQQKEKVFIIGEVLELCTNKTKNMTSLPGDP